MFIINKMEKKRVARPYRGSQRGGATYNKIVMLEVKNGGESRAFAWAGSSFYITSIWKLRCSQTCCTLFSSLKKIKFASAVLLLLCSVALLLLMSSPQETLLFNRLLAAAGAALFSSSSLKWCGKGGDGYIEALPGSYMGCSMLRVNTGRRVPSFFLTTRPGYWWSRRCLPLLLLYIIIGTSLLSIRAALEGIEIRFNWINLIEIGNI